MLDRKEMEEYESKVNEVLDREVVDDMFIKCSQEVS
jgi:hypothetical protein